MRVFFSVRYQLGGMPTGAPVQQVEDDIVMNEQQVTFYLSVEFVGKVDVTHVGWPWLCPHAANFAGFTHFWDKVENIIRYSNSFQKLVHDFL